MWGRDDIFQEQAVAVWLAKPADKLAGLRLARRVERRLQARAATYDRYVGVLTDIPNGEGEELPWDEYVGGGIEPERVLEEKQATEAVLERLTPFQRQIAARLAFGLAQWEIAEELHVTPACVCQHVQAMRRRLGE